MKLADYSQEVTVDQLDGALRAGGVEGVFHYLAGTHGFALRIETPEVVKGIRARGWRQLGIDIPTLDFVDGEAAARRTGEVYGFGPGFRLALDIEPAQFALDPAGWVTTADGWCGKVRSHGYSPGVYGTDATVAACANHADWIWRAKPGLCEPAGPGLAAGFFDGHRAIQCDKATFQHVDFDVNFSQFTLGDEAMFGPEDIASAIAEITYFSVLNRAPEPGAIDGHIKVGMKQGLRAMVEGICTSDEANNDLTQFHRLMADFTAGKLGGH
jgi:hypothetical protein